MAKAHNGVLDLRGWDPERHGPVALSGEWFLYWGKPLSPAEMRAGSGKSVAQAVVVPTRWPALTKPQATAAGYRAATYQLDLELPESVGPLMLSVGSPNAVHDLWLDEQLVAHQGELGSSAQDERPAIGDYLAPVESGKSSRRVLLRITSHFTRTLWLRTAPVLGTPAQILDARATIIAWPALLLGILSIAAVYHLGIYALSPRQTGQLIFGLYCLVVGIRQVLVGPHSIAPIVFSGLSYELVVKLEYFCLYVSMYLGIALIRRLFPRDTNQLPLRFFEGLSLLFPAACLLLSIPDCMRTLPVFQACGLLALLCVVYSLTQAVRHERPFARIILLCVLAYLGATVHDVLVTNGKIGAWAELSAPSLLLFLAVQAWALAKSYASSLIQVATLSEDLQQANRELTSSNHDLVLTNRSVARFVPHEFLSQLQRSSIRDVQRGDHVSLHMEVLFCDIRSFTSMVENMQPSAAFAFINDYLSVMEPVIHEHGGFINQYLGDGIMALFPNGADAAVRAAIGMQERLHDFNTRQRHTKRPIAIGIGVNSGPLMLGTIGGQHRLDSGVVGDAVNLAARMEQMSKVYGAALVISELTYQRLADPSQFLLRQLDVVIPRGKMDAIRIYEGLDGLPQTPKGLKLRTRVLFEYAVQLAARGQWSDALINFEHCLGMDASDVATQFHQRRCMDALRDTASTTNELPAPRRQAGGLVEA